ncbi:copper resistance D family protein [Pseudonocardia sp.]|uniref:copper resistance D family protein n=1 Tax=Pseudonocardia sp. TaxID=60912 RepID=UPI003D0F20B0
MQRATARPGTTSRLLPVLWAGLAVAAAVVAGVLADALSSSTFSARIATAVTRSGMDVAGIACVGLGLLAALVRTRGVSERDIRTLDRRLDRAIVAVGGAWLVVVLCDTAFRAADAYGRPVTAVGGGELLRWATSLASGRGLVLTAACVLVVIGCATARLVREGAVPPRAALVAALLGLLTPAVTGHAGTSSDHELAVIMSALHVAAASAWVGGLAAMLLFLGGRRALLDPVVPRFSRLATFCIIGVGITGVLNALLRLPSVGALVTGGYGWLIITKVVLLAGIAVLGNAARRRLAAGRFPVLRWAAVEVTLMALAVGVAAALTQTA